MGGVVVSGFSERTQKLFWHGRGGLTVFPPG